MGSIVNSQNPHVSRITTNSTSQGDPEGGWEERISAYELYLALVMTAERPNLEFYLQVNAFFTFWWRRSFQQCHCVVVIVFLFCF